MVSPMKAANGSLPSEWSTTPTTAITTMTSLSWSCPKITFTANIKPACLPTSETKDYSDMASTISGWGGTIGYSNQQPQQPRQCELKESVVKVLSPTSEKCSSYLRTTTSTSKLCAWAEGTDTCQGDSGGPLTVAESG